VIRIELVGRTFQKLTKRGLMMLVAALTVVLTVFAVNRLTSSSATTASVVPPMESSVEVEDQMPAPAPPARPTLASGAVREKATPNRKVNRDQAPRRRQIAVSRERREGGSRRQSRHGQVRFDPGSTDPVWTEACRQTLMLYERLPPAIRFKSLTGNVDGEYSIEGLTSSSRGALSQVQDTLRAYTQLDSVPAFLEGSTEKGLRFTFRGRFAELEWQELTALSQSQAAEVFAQVQGWARNSGLREVKVKDPIAKQLDQTHSRHRQKVWGRGSPRQIREFVDRFQQVGQQATLGEMIVIPVYGEGASRSNALLYAAVDILVYE
jgi:hypothetical protein